MTNKELLENQAEVIRFLRNSYETDHVSHAYILEGEDGSGTYEAAIYMSMLLLCESDNKPCLRCHNCLRIEKNNHINVSVIEGENNNIKKEQIQELIHELSMTSLEKGPQIAIIKAAEQMNTSASNTLLKLLEEPSPNKYIFLLTSNVDRLLDTIVSRSQVIHFKPLSKSYIINNLVEGGVDLDMAYILSYVTKDVEEAKTLISEGKVYNCLSLAMDLVRRKLEGKDSYITFQRQKNFLFDEKDKKWHNLFLDILILINEEFIKIANGISLGYFENLMKMCDKDKIDVQDIINRIDIITKYAQRLNYNVNKELFYASLMVEI